MPGAHDADEAIPEQLLYAYLRPGRTEDADLEIHEALPQRRAHLRPSWLRNAAARPRFGGNHGHDVGAKASTKPSFARMVKVCSTVRRSNASRAGRKTSQTSRERL